MGMLIFLAADFFLALPFRYVGGEARSTATSRRRLAFFGIVLIVPGMALAAVLGARTYRRRGAGRPASGPG